MQQKRETRTQLNDDGRDGWKKKTQNYGYIDFFFNLNIL